MSVDRRHQAADRMMTRRHGMNETARKQLNDQLGLMKDWFVICPTCGTKVTGTAAQIAEHGDSCGA